jgi:hypothetical protein
LLLKRVERGKKFNKWNNNKVWQSWCQLRWWRRRRQQQRQRRQQQQQQQQYIYLKYLKCLNSVQCGMFLRITQYWFSPFKYELKVK